MLVEELLVNSGDGLFSVENGGEIEWNSDVDVSGGGSVFSNVFKE
jgi:hypothetical protein